MVPFIAKVPFVVSQPTSRYSDWITVTVAGAKPARSEPRRVGSDAGGWGWGSSIVACLVLVAPPTRPGGVEDLSFLS